MGFPCEMEWLSVRIFNNTLKASMQLKYNPLWLNTSFLHLPCPQATEKMGITWNSQPSNCSSVKKKKTGLKNTVEKGRKGTHIIYYIRENSLTRGAQVFVKRKNDQKTSQIDFFFFKVKQDYIADKELNWRGKKNVTTVKKGNSSQVLWV